MSKLNICHILNQITKFLMVDCHLNDVKHTIILSSPVSAIIILCDIEKVCCVHMGQFACVSIYAYGITQIFIQESVQWDTKKSKRKQI